jgi:hypothetical protein
MDSSQVATNAVVDRPAALDKDAVQLLGSLRLVTA